VCAPLIATGQPDSRAAADDSAAPVESPSAAPAGSPSAAQLAGQRTIFGFHGTSAPRPLLRRIHRGEAAGVILFRRNIESRGQVAKLTAAFQRWRPDGDPPLLVMVDQEGGIVKRLAGPPNGSAAAMGRGSETAARTEGLRTGRLLRSLGIDVDLAPVADLGRAGRIMRKQERAFSSSPMVAARQAAAFARGLRDGGVAATAKHFPGLGGAKLDQDHALNTIELPLDRLRAEDYAPFERLIRDGVELVMTSTAIYPALDERPAAFSTRIVQGELRDRLGFKGVTITDSLGVASSSRLGSVESRAVRAACAGNDLILFAAGYASGARAAKAIAGEPPAPAAAGRVLALRRSLAR
jgi:beta-N-acetylhexosaminidase